MNKEKEELVQEVRERFVKYDLFFIEHAHGMFTVDRVNFWATFQKWYDPFRGVRGVGFHSFLKYLEHIQVCGM